MDIWSLGCILAELLKLLLPSESNNKDEPNQMFAGETCYPLSPLKDVVLGHIDYNDQLRYILDVVQKPDEHDLAFITEASAIEYVRNVGSLTS